MDTPNQDPDLLLDQTAASLKYSQTDLPTPAGRELLTDWFAQLGEDTDPQTKALVAQLQQLLPMLSGATVTDPAIKSLLREISEQVTAMANAIPDDDVPVGPSQRPRRHRRKVMSELAWSLHQMSG